MSPAELLRARAMGHRDERFDVAGRCGNFEIDRSRPKEAGEYAGTVWSKVSLSGFWVSPVHQTICRQHEDRTREVSPRSNCRWRRNFRRAAKLFAEVFS